MKICLCTPMYGGLCNAAFMAGVLELQMALKSLNVDFTYFFVINDSLITRARNKLCKYFMESNSTHLLFIDADIEFRVIDVINMIKSDKQLVGCAYAIKSLNWNKIAETAASGCKDPQLLKQSGLMAVVNTIMPISNDIVQVAELGTGLLLIKREVFDIIMRKNPNDLLLLDSPEDLNKTQNERIYYRFFDTAVENNRYLSEDYVFCKKWKECGGLVYMLKNTETKHWGNFAYEFKN